MKMLRRCFVLFLSVVAIMGLAACGAKESTYTFSLEDNVQSEFVTFEGNQSYYKLVTSSGDVCYIIPGVYSTDTGEMYVGKENSSDGAGFISFYLYSEDLDLEKITAKIDGELMSSNIVPEDQLTPSILVDPEAPNMDGYITLPTKTFKMDNLSLGKQFVVVIEGLV